MWSSRTSLSFSNRMVQNKTPTISSKLMIKGYQTTSIVLNKSYYIDGKVRSLNNRGEEGRKGGEEEERRRIGGEEEGRRRGGEERRKKGGEERRRRGGG